MRVVLVVAALALGACVIDSPSPTAARFQLAWTFEGGGDCETLGVEIIHVNMMFSGGFLTDQFLCTDGFVDATLDGGPGGVTHAVENDVSYSVQLVAFDADGNELGRSEARSETVLGTGETAELEPFVIDTSGT